MERNIIRIDESKCIGCSLCVNACTQDALKLIDNKAVLVSDDYCDGLGMCLPQCPVDAITVSTTEIEFDRSKSNIKLTSSASALNQWPIQLHLVSPQAEFFKNSNLLVAADCVAFSYGGFHEKLLDGKSLVIACPKLDDTDSYVEKLAIILKENSIKTITLAIMEVPCCGGLRNILQKAIVLSGVNIPLREVIVARNGEIF